MDTASTFRNTFSSSGSSPIKEIVFQKRRLSLFEPYSYENIIKNKTQREAGEKRKGKAVLKISSFQLSKIREEKLEKGKP